METDPRKMKFWIPPQIGEVYAYPGPLPIYKEIETCRTVYPKYDLGHDEVEYRGTVQLVYATIDVGPSQTCRLTPFHRKYLESETLAPQEQTNQHDRITET
jgi:hypothetical protein